MHCEGKFLSLRKRKELYGANGQLLFYLQSKILSFPKVRRPCKPLYHAEPPQTYKGLDPQSDTELFQCKTHISLIGSKMSMHFTNAYNHQPVELALRGTFWDRSAQITIKGGPLDGQIVAYVSRSFLNMRCLLMEAETFYITVAAGFDMFVELSLGLDRSSIFAALLPWPLSSPWQITKRGSAIDTCIHLHFTSVPPTTECSRAF
jgi:hypothetical protein